MDAEDHQEPKGWGLFRAGYRMGRCVSQAPGYMPIIILALAVGWYIDHTDQQAKGTRALESSLEAWCPFWKTDQAWCIAGSRYMRRPSLAEYNR